MKTNEQKNNNKVTGARIAVEAIVAIIGLAGLVLLAGDEAPNAAAPMTLSEWLAIKAAGAILVGVAVLAYRAAHRAGIIY
nr:MAG TPA: hypothetical protein [Caudoviricetes sp.]DAX67164.1 MAG TPA: hypothetical protein [Caudoviricetes sp.]